MLYAELNPLQVFSLNSKFPCSERDTFLYNVRISAEWHVYIYHQIHLYDITDTEV